MHTAIAKLDLEEWLVFLSAEHRVQGNFIFMFALDIIHNHNSMEVVDYKVGGLDKHGCWFDYLCFLYLDILPMPFLQLEQLPLNSQTTIIANITPNRVIQINLIQTMWLIKWNLIRRSIQMIRIRIDGNFIINPWANPLALSLFQLPIIMILIFNPI